MEHASMGTAELHQLIALQQLQQAQQLQQIQQFQQVPLQQQELQGLLSPAAAQQFLAFGQQPQIPAMPPVQPGIIPPQQMNPAAATVDQALQQQALLAASHLQPLSGVQMPTLPPVQPSPAPPQQLTPAAAAVDQVLKQQAEGTASGPFFSFDAPVDTLRTTEEAVGKRHRERASQPQQAPAPLGQVKVLTNVKAPVASAPASRSGQSSWVTVERRSRSHSRRRRRRSRSGSSSSGSSSRGQRGGHPGSAKGRREQRAAEKREEAASALFAAGKPRASAKSAAKPAEGDGRGGASTARPSILDQFQQQKQQAQQSLEQQPSVRQFTVEELLQGQSSKGAQPRPERLQQQQHQQQQQQQPQLPKGMEHLEHLLKRQQPHQQHPQQSHQQPPMGAPQWQGQYPRPMQTPPSQYMAAPAQAARPTMANGGHAPHSWPHQQGGDARGGSRQGQRHWAGASLPGGWPG